MSGGDHNQADRVSALPVGHQCCSGRWVAECFHPNGDVWMVHRRTEYAATRSLAAHARDCRAGVSR